MPQNVAAMGKRQRQVSVDASTLQHGLKHLESRSRHYRMLPVALIFYALSFSVLFLKVDVTPGYEVQEALRSRWADMESPDVVTADTPMQFCNVGDVEEFWMWVYDRLVPEVFVQTSFDGADIEASSQRVLTYNRILGGLHFEQERAREADCYSDAYDMFYGRCYPTDTLDDTNEFRHNLTLTVWLEDSIEVEDLLEEVDFLSTAGWIDEATKNVRITLVVYNGEYDVFAELIWRFDFMRGGRVHLRHEAASVAAHPYDEWYASVLDALFVGSMLALLATELGEARRAMQSHTLHFYLTSVWNQLDVAVIAFMMVLCVEWGLIVYGVSLVDLTDRDASDAVEELDEYLAMISDLDTTMQKMLSFKVTGMVFMLLMSVRILKYFTFQPRLSLLTSTMLRAAGDLTSFLLFFMLIFVSFVLGSHFLFGQSLKEFHSVPYATSTLFNLLWGDFDYEAMRQVSGTGAFIFFWSYTALVVLLLINMLLSIVIDSFSTTKDTVGNTETLGEEIGAQLRYALGQCGARALCPTHFYAKKGLVAPVEVLKYLEEHAGHETVTPADLADALGLDHDTAYEFIERVRTTYRAHNAVDLDNDGVPDEIEHRLQRMEQSLAVVLEGLDTLSKAVTGKGLDLKDTARRKDAPPAGAGPARAAVDGAFPVPSPAVAVAPGGAGGAAVPIAEPPITAAGPPSTSTAYENV